MAFRLDFSPLEAEFTDPTLLQHPFIPRPLSGVNPRTILGETWWKHERRAAYAKNNYQCHACGCDTSDDPFDDKLHAHECYEIVWNKASAKYIGTVALCYSCHNFIHCGRLSALVEEGKASEEKLFHVLVRGLKILESNGLKPYWRVYVLAREFLDRMLPYDAIGKARELYGDEIQAGDLIRLPDRKWTLEIAGVKYRRKSDGRISQV